MRSILGILIGVIVGAIGAVLFMQSLPAKKGSLQARADKAEFEWAKAEQEMQTLRAQLDPNRRKISQRQAMEGIAERIRSGKRVSLDDVFSGTMKPWMRDVAPLFDRGRVAGEKRRLNRLSGELTREYELDDRQQEALSAWLDQRAEANGNRFGEVLNDPDSGFVDFAKVMDERTSSQRYRRELDAFMATTLDEETLATYQLDRMTERVEWVQNEAEGRMQRLDSLVELDEEQQDQAFAILAHSSEHFDPSMQFDGVDSDVGGFQPGMDARDGLNQILNTEQRQILEDREQERRAEVLREFQQVGLTPPRGWEEMEGNPF